MITDIANALERALKLQYPQVDICFQEQPSEVPALVVEISGSSIAQEINMKFRHTVRFNITYIKNASDSVDYFEDVSKIYGALLCLEYQNDKYRCKSLKATISGNKLHIAGSISNLVEFVHDGSASESSVKMQTQNLKIRQE